jgi:hypothetical protein
MVASISKGGERKLTEKFMRFAEHYGFTAIFCNPDAGNEKGSVENKVGYHRHNMLVPVPKFEDLSEYNKYLLTLADADGKRNHYIKGDLIENLFEDDKAALMPLPKNEFDTARYIVCKADNYGFIRLNEGKHEYSTAPKYAGAPVTVKYSGIYSILPDVVQEYIAKSNGAGTSTIIKMIAELAKRTSFESAAATVAQAISHNALDADSLMALHRRLFMDIPELPPLCRQDFPPLDPLLPNLADYDVAIDRRS